MTPPTSEVFIANERVLPTPDEEPTSQNQVLDIRCHFSPFSALGAQSSVELRAHARGSSRSVKSTVKPPRLQAGRSASACLFKRMSLRINR